MDPINVNAALASFEEPWRPRIIGHFQDAKVQVAKFDGDFVWHRHDDSDDLFLVLEGELLIDLPDRTVEMSPGDLFVVPAGLRHRPRARGWVHVLNLERAGTVNTGDAADPGELRAPEQGLPPSPKLNGMEPAAGELVNVADGSAQLDGLVFDTPSSSKVIVAVVDPSRGPVFRTVNPSALTVRTEAGPDDRALRLLVRRTPPPAHDAARGAARSGQRRSGFTRGAAHRPTGR